jgi:MFS family permease
VFAGAVIFICMGTIYSWSVFRKPLELLLGVGATESGLPYTVFLCCYALSMPIAGQVIEKIGPKMTALLGGFILSLGWVLSGYAGNITSFVITFGVLGGCGVGLVYGAPLAVVANWFPQNRGLAVGLTLAGFGLSPFITAPAAHYLIVHHGVLSTFKIFGILFFVCIAIFSQFLKFPASDQVPDPSRVDKDDSAPMRFKEMLRNREFCGLWSCFAIGAFSGLMAISVTSPIAQEVIELKPELAAYAVSVFAIFNSIGRPLFGMLTDKVGTRNTIILSFSSIICASVLILTSSTGDYFRYFLSFSLFWLALGGWLATAPVSTSKLFGIKNFSRNYGFVFTAYGVGAIAGGLASGVVKDILGSYTYAFYLTIVLAVCGIFVCLATLSRRNEISLPKSLTRETLGEA